MPGALGPAASGAGVGRYIYRSFSKGEVQAETHWRLFKVWEDTKEGRKDPWGTWGLAWPWEAGEKKAENWRLGPGCWGRDYGKGDRGTCFLDLQPRAWWPPECGCGQARGTLRFLVLPLTEWGPRCGCRMWRNPQDPEPRKSGVKLWGQDGSYSLSPEFTGDLPIRQWLRDCSVHTDGKPRAFTQRQPIPTDLEEPLWVTSRWEKQGRTVRLLWCCYVIPGLQWINRPHQHQHRVRPGKHRDTLQAVSGSLNMVWGGAYPFCMEKVKVKVTQSSPTFCDPMDYTVHGILQARILQWVAFPFSRGSSQPRDWTQVSRIAGRYFTSWATREAQESLYITALLVLEVNTIFQVLFSWKTKTKQLKPWDGIHSHYKMAIFRRGRDNGVWPWLPASLTFNTEVMQVFSGEGSSVLE